MATDALAKKKRRHIEDVGPRTSVRAESQTDDYDGIDVSSYQKDIDWEKVCADKRIRFVYIKATEGSTYTSPHFEFNIENARKHGLKVGSYHFLRTTSSLKSQFENFIKSARRDEQDLRPLIDFENKGSWNRKQIVDSLEAFAQMVREYYHCEPMIYTMTSFYNSYLTPFFAKYPLFIARYSQSEPQLVDGAKYLLWQFTDQGTVEGIDHHVDMCRFGDGVGLRDIMIGVKEAKLNGLKTVSELKDDPAIQHQAPKIHTPKKFKSTPQKATENSDNKQLTKEEKKLKEKDLKEQLKEEKRQKKLKEKAKKDSIKLAEKKAESRRDSISKAKEEKSGQKKSEQKKQAQKSESKEKPVQKAVVKTPQKTSDKDTKNATTAATASDNQNVKKTDSKAATSAAANEETVKEATYKKQYSTRRSKK